MAGHPVFSMSMTKVYPLLVQKAEGKAELSPKSMKSFVG